MPEFPFHGKISDKILYLLHYAALAPSAFNTQPWKFQIKHDSVIVYADTSCWMKIADPEKRQLFISLGCAVENLMVAARHFGLESTCIWQEDTSSFEVNFSAGNLFKEEPLFEAIERRHTYYGDFEERPIEKEKVDEILNCLSKDFALFLFEDKNIMHFIDELWLKCDIAQYADPLFRKEFYQLFQEGVLDPWMLMEKLGRLSTILEKGTSFSPLRKAPVFALLCAQKSDEKSWAEIGRIFERIFLKATSLRLKFKPVCSFIAEEYAREKLKSFLPDPKWIAIQPFTFGYAKDGPPLQKKKRPLKTMLVK